MLKKIKRAYSVAPIATVVFAISLVLALGFSGRLIVDAFDGPPPQSTQIEEWMTPRYISRTWKIPPDVMRDFLELEKSSGRPDNLLQIAEARGMDVDALITELKAEIDQFVAARKAERDRK